MARRPAPPNSSPRPEGLRRGLRALLGTVTGEIDRAIAGPVAAPELLHDLHRDLRRLAGGLVLWAELIEARDAAEVRPLVRRIRRFARLVGRVRDRDVTLTLLEPLLDLSRGGPERRAFHAFVGRLREDGRTGRELLRAFLTTERRGGLVDRVRELLGRSLRAAAAHELVEVFHEEWRSHRRRVRKAHRKARKKPNAERLHRLRIQIRRWRHLMVLADLAEVPPPEPADASLRPLQERLGHLHDLDVALSSFPEALARSAAARRIATALRRESVALERMLARRHPAASGRRTGDARRRPRG